MILRKSKPVAATPPTSAPHPARERVALTPGMFAWTMPWTIRRDGERYLVPTAVYDRSSTPGGTSCCLVLRTEDGWYLGGEVDEINDDGGHPADEFAAAELVTPELLDVHYPTWREQFQGRWTPDPRPTTAADHLHIADVYSNLLLGRLNASGVGNTPVDPMLRLAEYHQRHAQFRIDEARRLPVDDPEREREEAAMRDYLRRRPPGWPERQR